MKWRVSAWVMSPGDFPQRLLKHTTVDAGSIRAAITKAEASLAFQIDPVTVQAVRIHPPASQEIAS